jgi:amino acid transporter
VIEYVATNFFVNNGVTATVTGASGATTTVSGYDAAAVSAAPIGDMVKFIGDTMLGGTGTILALILAVTVLVALIGTTLACLNTGVRITYVMGRDKEVPGILGALHGKYATPHYGVLALAVLSAILGAYGVLSADNLLQITLASNTGTFLVYGMTNFLVIVAFAGRPGRSFLRHIVVPFVGAVANILMLAAIIFMSISAGGSTQTDTVIAIGIVLAWVVAGLAWLFVTSASRNKRVLVTEKVNT